MPNSTIAADEHSFPECWKNLRGKRVLEIGSGTGRHTVRLLDQENEVLGIDISEGMLAVARHRLSGKPVKLIHGDFLQLDLCQLIRGKPFDAAISALVLEHIQDLNHLFQKVGQCLLPRASFYVSEIHPDRAREGKLAHFIDRVSGEESWLDGFVHTQDAIQRSAQFAGFEILKKIDVLGTHALANLHPDWKKYLARPMVQLWEFRWLGATK